MADELCPLCGDDDAQITFYGGFDNRYKIECKTCGNFLLPRDDWDYIGDSKLQKSRLHLSALVREYWIRYNKPITLIFNEPVVSSKQLPHVIISSFLERFPKTVASRADRALLNLALLSNYPGERLLISESDASLFFVDVSEHSQKIESMTFTLAQLIQDRMIDGTTIFPVDLMLTPRGWNRVHELESTSNPDTKQAFVAMWFGPEVYEAYENGIYKAIKDAGYEPLKINDKEHNNQISDEIIAEIRRSKFIVCDFTGDRGGVYFEAGFAMGLGIPVIWTCRKDYMKCLHFDTQQYNHIVWETPEQLYKGLYNRIRATIV